MVSLPGNINGDTYKYIMSAIDTFRRFLFLRPLQTKETSEVTEHVLNIYLEHGPPGTCKAIKVRNLRTFARKFFNIDFFRKLLPL